VKIDRPFLKIILAIFFALAVFLIKDFITLLLTSMIISFLIKPFYIGLDKIIRKPGLSALISELIFFSVMAGLFLFIINSAYYQIVNFGSPLIGQLIDIDSYLKELGDSNLLIDLSNDITMQAFNIILSEGKEYLFKTPLMFIDIILLFYTTFYFVKDSEKI